MVLINTKSKSILSAPSNFNPLFHAEGSKSDVIRMHRSQESCKEHICVCYMKQMLQSVAFVSINVANVLLVISFFQNITFSNVMLFSSGH